MHGQSNFDGLTGSLFEERELGKCLATHTGYLTFNDALTRVRNSQPPVKTKLRVHLEREVSARIGKPVRCYTAVGSTLDKKHGTDAVIECIEFVGTVVTLDLTLNSDKDEHKADLVVHGEELGNVSELAGMIARSLQSKLSRRR